ncbi:hypothetical protein J2X46_001123 [Nocardioides sp. BE266]|uniref:hypothetical protein n=1 Tax=Nocardioides sp. BE266 TaxID=2817725 RepID=UPI0028547A84|nr:hypothetical protein [Nocardioides sp. BE266]MDR7252147.1 hypothetical protein [Nocardioides sp. BE266]
MVSMAATAPAFAASCGATTYAYTLDWNTATINTSTSGNAVTATTSITGPAGSSAILATFKSTTTGSVTRDSDNLTVSSETNVGNLGGKALNISHSSPITAGSGNRQTVAISFNRAVTGLNFYISDIDSSLTNVGSQRNPVYSGWWDRVSLTGTYTPNRDTNLRGSGTSNDPWYYNDSDTNVGNEAAGARVKVTYSGTIAANTTITLEYWTTQAGGNQRIFLTDFGFDAKGC